MRNDEQKKIIALKGFTLVETLVAIAILMIMVTTPFMAIQQSLNASHVTRDEMIADNLAQEGVEFVRYVRDHDYLATYASPGTYSWLYDLDGTSATQINCFAPNKCLIDPSVYFTPLRMCANGDCTPYPLYVNSNNVYNQSSNGTATRFTRWITLTWMDAAHTQARVDVVVIWTTDHLSYTTKISEYLTNWQPASSS